MKYLHSECGAKFYLIKKMIILLIIGATYGICNLV